MQSAIRHLYTPSENPDAKVDFGARVAFSPSVVFLQMRTWIQHSTACQITGAKMGKDINEPRGSIAKLLGKRVSSPGFNLVIRKCLPFRGGSNYRKEESETDGRASRPRSSVRYVVTVAAAPKAFDVTRFFLLFSSLSSISSSLLLKINISGC